MKQDKEVVILYLYIYRERERASPKHKKKKKKKKLRRQKEKKKKEEKKEVGLVVMASTAGEASYISCTFKCEVLCDDQDYKAECISKCMADCKDTPPPPFTQLNHTRSNYLSLSLSKKKLSLYIYVYMHACT